MTEQYTREELKAVRPLVQKACEEYTTLSEQLINLFETKYNFTFLETHALDLLDKYKQDSFLLNSNWKFWFHSGDICFEHVKTQQIIDITLRYKPNYAVINHCFFIEYLRTRTSYKDIGNTLFNNKAKYQQILHSLKKTKHLKIIQRKNYPDIYVWNRKFDTSNISDILSNLFNT